MKQLFQKLNKGETVIENIPSPQTQENHLLIQTSSSLVSSGTERMIVDFSKSGLIVSHCRDVIRSPVCAKRTKFTITEYLGHTQPRL